MFLRLLLLGLLFLICTEKNTAQSPTDLLSNYLNSFHSEKIYISHNQPYYATGETIWCKVFLVDGRSHKSFNAKPLIYVDWINPKGEIIKTYTLQVNDGTAALDIPTERIDPIGNYTLRAYTLYQKNFEEVYLFQKEIQLTDRKEKETEKEKNIQDFTIQFFPEGGDLVANLANKIAFKAQDDTQKNIAISGKILKENGEKVADLKTLNEGMGFFNLLPKANEKYIAEINFNNQKKTFELPKTLSRGHLLKVNTRHNELVIINLSSNTKSLLKSCRLVGHLRGSVFFDQSFEEKATLTLSLNKEDLPTGLLHFTLFDSQNRPVSERLVFNKNKREKVSVNLNLKDTVFVKRALVEGGIKVEQNKKISTANLSLSVFNADLLAANLNGLTIENYLLLQSDLKGRIVNINQYFEKDDAKTRTLLDLLLLTHGWRKFTWQQILDKEQPDLIYPTEESFSLSGQIKKFGKDKPVKSNVFVNVLNQNDFSFSNVTTGEDGLFFFDGFTFEDTTDILIQANIYNERKAQKVKEGTLKRVGNKDVDITLFQLQELAFNNTYTLKPSSYKPKTLQKYIKEIAAINGEEEITESLWTLDLDAVTVKEKKLSYRQIRWNDLEEKYKKKGMFYFNSTDKFFTEDLFKYTPKFIDIFDLLVTAIPGARWSGPQGGKQVFLNPIGSSKGPGEAVFAVDGVLTSSSQLNAILPEEVESIELITGLRADAIYNRPAVIVVLLKESAERTKAVLDAQNIGMVQQQHPGFYQAKAFYSPVYETKNPDKSLPDNRTTLFWNADLKINNQAESFQFYTGDIIGNYLLYIEGITDTGMPFIAKKMIRVEE